MKHAIYKHLKNNTPVLILWWSCWATSSKTLNMDNYFLPIWSQIKTFLPSLFSPLNFSSTHPSSVERLNSGSPSVLYDLCCRSGGLVSHWFSSTQWSKMSFFRTCTFYPLFLDDWLYPINRRYSFPPYVLLLLALPSTIKVGDSALSSELPTGFLAEALRNNLDTCNCWYKYELISKNPYYSMVQTTLFSPSIISLFIELVQVICQ